MRFLFKNIFLNFYLVLQVFAVSMGLLCSSFSYAETNVLKDFQNYAKEDIPLEIEEVKNSVVGLGLNQENPKATGFILEDGILATNVHVLLELGLSSSNKTNPYPLSQIKILQEDRLLDVQITSIQALDMVHDLALLNIKGSEIPPAIKKPRRKVDLTKEQLFLVGYPKEKLKAMEQKGPIEIFELEDRIEEVHMPISTNDIHGASGSPIVNQKGEVVGVAHSIPIAGRKVIFSNNDLLFSLRNAEYGVECSKNTSIKNCFKKAEDFLFKEAEKGDAYAQFQLGRFFYEDYFYLKRENNFEKWMKSAAQADFAKAQANLGMIYSSYFGKYKEGLKWLEQASEQGYFAGTTLLAEIYYEGKEVPKDYKKAREYFELAAQQGNSKAYYSLGVIYHQGEGVSQDYKKAFQYFELAAQKGHIDSIFELGKMYYHGQAVPQDLKKAREYFETISQQEYKEAQDYISKLKYKKYISDIGKYIEETFYKGAQ